jgi:hypothetical protein
MSVKNTWQVAGRATRTCGNKRVARIWLPPIHDSIEGSECAEMIRMLVENYPQFETQLDARLQGARDPGSAWLAVSGQSTSLIDDLCVASPIDVPDQGDGKVSELHATGVIEIVRLAAPRGN